MLLIKNAVVITMNQTRQVFLDGGIAVDGKRIAAVGKSDEIERLHTYDQVIDAKGKTVMPGLINAHVHLFQTLYRGMGDGMTLTDWLNKCVYNLSAHLDEDASRTGALLSGVEMIKSGITTYVDSHYITHDKRCYDGIAQGTLELGMRGVLCRSTVNNTGNPRFIEEIGTAQKECERVIKAYHGYGDGILSVRLEPLNEYSATREMIVAMRDVANAHNVGLSMHLAETRERVEGSLEQYGCTPVEFLQSLGVLGPNTLLAHCVWVTEQDMALLKGSRTNVAHNSISNQYLADGVAPISRMVKSGINVTLGTDGAASNNNLDMFNTMKAAVMLQKATTLDAVSLTAEDALEMATVNAARALGMEDLIGSLEPDKRADLIFIDQMAVEMVPNKSHVSNLVYAATPHVVETVMVDGKIIMQDRQLTMVDEAAVLRDANRTLDRLVEKSGYDFQVSRVWEIVT